MAGKLANQKNYSLELSILYNKEPRIQMDLWTCLGYMKSLGNHTMEKHSRKIPHQNMDNSLIY